MKRMVAILAIVIALPSLAQTTAPAKTSAPAAKAAKSKVDPAVAAAHAKEDIKRHRTIAAAHEAAAKCQESGRAEAECMSELAKSCKGIAYGKYCGMKHD